MGGENNLNDDLDISLFDDTIEFEVDDDSGVTPDAGEKGDIPKTPVISGEEFLDIDDEDTNQDLTVDEDDEEEDTTSTSKTKTEKKPTTSSDAKSGDASSPPSQLYAAFAKKLAEDGVLSDFDDEEFNTLVEESGSPSEALVALARKSVDSAIEEYKSSADADYKAFLEAREVGASPDILIDTQKLITYLEDMDEDDLKEDSEKSEFVIRQLLTSKGMKPVKIDKLIKQYDALGTTEEEALEAKEELIELKKEELESIKTTAKAQRAEMEARVEKQREELKTFVDNTTELIPGVKLSTKDKETIYSTITKPAGNYPNGQPYNAAMAVRMKNPLAFERTLHYLLHLGVFNLDDKNNPKPDWSKLTKVKQTATASEFDKLLSGSSQGITQSGKSAKTRSEGILDLGLNI